MKQFSHNSINVFIPETVLEKSRGLLGQENLLQKGWLLIPHCNWVHSFFMQNPIKLYFLDSSFCIVNVVSELLPNRLSPLVIKAAHTLETPLDTVDNDVSNEAQFFQEVLRT